MYSVIGLVVAIFAYAIVNWVVGAASNTASSYTDSKSCVAAGYKWNATTNKCE